MSVVLQTLEPYVCTDVEAQKRFVRDEDFLKRSIRSYIALPLMKQGKLIGVVDFLSSEKRHYTNDQIHLLQGVSEIISIAVINALAYDEINTLKQQLQLENRLLQDEIVQRSIFEEIVGSSTSLQKVLAAIDKVAATDSTVLITEKPVPARSLSLMLSIDGHPDPIALL